MEVKPRTDCAKEKNSLVILPSQTPQHELWHCPPMTVVMLVHERMRMYFAHVKQRSQQHRP